MEVEEGELKARHAILAFQKLKEEKPECDLDRLQDDLHCSSIVGGEQRRVEACLLFTDRVRVMAVTMPAVALQIPWSNRWSLRSR